MNSIESRLTTLESGLKSIENLNSTIGNFMHVLANAEGTPGLANLLQGIPNTPAPHQGKGVGL